MYCIIAQGNKKLRSYEVKRVKCVKSLRWIAVFFCLMPLVATATKYAGEFQELGVGARVCAMGGTGVAQCTDASVISLNPAGTIFVSRGVLFMHAENFGGIVKNEFGSVVVPKGKSAFGIALQYISVGDIKLTTLTDTTLPPDVDNPPIPYDTVSTRDAILYLNGSKTNGILSYGLNLKVYYRDLAVITGLGGGLDLGLRIDLKNLKTGIAVRDFILSPLVWDNETRENISPKVSFGVAPEIPIEKFNSIMTFECDLVKSLDITGFNLSFGFEYAYKNTLFVRLGRTNGRYSLGIGLKYKKLKLDYALMTHSALNNSNKFSLGVEF